MFSSSSFYYHLKPLIPRSVQIRLRRRVVLGKRTLYRDVWPIDERAANPPAGWQGWPDGKKFALVLTHDVETARGYEKCARLARLDRDLGLRSSFNFVPEGYRVFERLRQDLVTNGFEVGIHGLTHSGNIYSSLEKFSIKAERINQYLKKWGSVGFRTPSMYHNLDMLQYLNVEYDASTFDTDPFEPQPDGVSTIFPFWVPGITNNGGCVELPYTLPQDFTLFILMKEQSIDIWKKKLDWIASNGGMALLLVHPDYMRFDDKEPETDEYPAAYYIEFLEYIKKRYAGEYWHALPKEIARFWAEHYSIDRWKAQEVEEIPRPRRAGDYTSPAVRGKLIVGAKRVQVTAGTRRQRACFVYYHRFNGSAVLYREAKALKEKGFEVDLICLRDSPDDKAVQVFEGLKLYGIQARPEREKKSMLYFSRLAAFSLKCSLLLSVLGLAKRYSIVHVTTPPDFLVFSALIPKLLGAKVVMDIHDIGPELYMRKLDVEADSTIVRVLKFMERVSAKFSDHVITVTDIWKDKIATRSAPPSKCTVLMNVPDEDMFSATGPVDSNLRETINLFYHGSLEEHFGVDTLIKAMPRVKDMVPQARLHIYGAGRLEEELRLLVQRTRLEEYVTFHGMVPFYELPAILKEADVGIVPTKGATFSEEALSMKSLEYMAMGIPIVISQTKVHSMYYDPSMVAFFRPGDEDDLVASLAKLCASKDERDRLAQNALKFIEKHGWSESKKAYYDVIDRLTATK